MLISFPLIQYSWFVFIMNYCLFWCIYIFWNSLPAEMDSNIFLFTISMFIVSYFQICRFFSYFLFHNWIIFIIYFNNFFARKNDISIDYLFFSIYWFFRILIIISVSYLLYYWLVYKLLLLYGILRFLFCVFGVFCDLNIFFSYIPIFFFNWMRHSMYYWIMVSWVILNTLFFTLKSIFYIIMIIICKSLMMIIFSLSNFFKISQYTPFVFHNLSNYRVKLFLHGIAAIINRDWSTIAFCWFLSFS